MTPRFAPVLVVFLLATATGCDGGSEEATTQPPQTTTTSASGRPSLERAVRSALIENRRLSRYVLSNNRIPVWAERSTRGPALSGLRIAAADRRRRGVRVRLLADRFRILSIRLDPSFTTATAVAQALQRVRPYGRDGKPLGRSVELNEKARIELRRLGRADRFVIWRVQIVP
ncbi:MAG: hypothetical protein ACRDM8_03080 [Gaiellaceae bacterium]